MAYSRIGRTSDQRRALLRSLVTSLFAQGKIETTETKAEEAASVAEKLITLAKENNLHNKRQAMAYILDEDVVKKLFDNIAPKYADKPGGYTRIIKTGVRRGDAAPLAILELI